MDPYLSAKDEQNESDERADSEQNDGKGDVKARNVIGLVFRCTTSGRNRPRKTETEKDVYAIAPCEERSRKKNEKNNTRRVPVIFPMAASACSSCIAAVRLVNRSGRLVPRATIVMPVTLWRSPMAQPSNSASCCTTAMQPSM